MRGEKPIKKISNLGLSAITVPITAQNDIQMFHLRFSYKETEIPIGYSLLGAVCVISDCTSSDLAKESDFNTWVPFLFHKKHMKIFASYLFIFFFWKTKSPFMKGQIGRQNYQYARV